MAAATPYYRIPVVIFAVLVGSLYVYAKGGGSLLSNRPQVTPATNSQGEALAPPRIEYMPGPKSAPAYIQAPVNQARQSQPRQVHSATPRQVLPGSKSRAVIDHSTFTPANAAPQSSVKFPPRQNNAPRGEPTANQVSPRARVLPGSKSMILIDPQTIAPPTNNLQPVPRMRVLPGSKSAILIDPASLAPPSNSANVQQLQRPPANRQPVYQQPAYQQPARGYERTQAPNNNVQQRAVSR